eukprot:GHVT01016399.1.p1 GENE.GHVT01016399.1~~GHVT01016399.1.p1  ORF type:complete len:216 (+),score=30.69 GHVT01016399.1:1500-2147(+)
MFRAADALAYRPPNAMAAHWIHSNRDNYTKHQSAERMRARFEASQPEEHEGMARHAGFTLCPGDHNSLGEAADGWRAEGLRNAKQPVEEFFEVVRQNAQQFRRKHSKHESFCIDNRRHRIGIFSPQVLRWFGASFTFTLPLFSSILYFSLRKKYQNIYKEKWNPKGKRKRGLKKIWEGRRNVRQVLDKENKAGKENSNLTPNIPSAKWRRIRSRP